MSGQIGVLLMAHGTPASAEGIAPFYTRIRRGRPPSDEQLAELEMRYAAIGGVSPLTQRTQAQVEGVRALLDTRAPDRFVVGFGAKHAEPLIEEGAAALARSGVDTIIGLVLTPHGSTMGSQEYMVRAEAALADGPRFTAVPPWFAHPGFVSLLADRVRQAQEEVSAGADPGRFPVLFSAHSLPERVRAMGDSYPDQLAESARLVAEEAKVARWSVAWQSAGRTPEPWLGPDVRDEVRRLAAEGGADGVVSCPIGFVADHLEVLYDIDIELAAVAQERGVALVRTASLNDDPRFMAVLADVVTDAAPED